jgi:hypothetical protein
LSTRRDARVWAAGDAAWGLIRVDALDLVSVHGRPPAAALAVALAGPPPGPDLFVLAEHLAHARALLPDRRVRPGALHVLAAGARTRAPLAHPTRLLVAADLHALRRADPALAEEQGGALAEGPVMAALDGALPVAFCYAHHRTERWWDVSIDTLATRRRRGFATAAAAGLIEHFRGAGLEPVWGALEENPASGATARGLGFVPVAPFAILSPG